MLLLLRHGLLAMVMLLASCPANKPTGNREGATLDKSGTVIIQGKTGAVSIAVEVVRSDAERAQGLMYRRQLAPKSGMLFIFEKDEIQSFWMKNTYIPLDMVFIDGRMKIVGIVESAEPHTTRSRKVDIPSRYVLEVNAGFTASRGIGEGDLVTFKGMGIK